MNRCTYSTKASTTNPCSSTNPTWTLHEEEYMPASWLHAARPRSHAMSWEEPTYMRLQGARLMPQDIGPADFKPWKRLRSCLAWAQYLVADGSVNEHAMLQAHAHLLCFAFLHDDLVDNGAEAVVGNKDMTPEEAVVSTGIGSR